MRLIETELGGVWLFEPDSIADERGSFTRVFDRESFANAGVNPHVEQCSLSFNRARGTLRGLHYQRAPHGEDKIVRCTRGAVYDVVLDIRADSPTFARWISLELSAENSRAVIIAAGLAHGFQTLTEDSEVYYQMAQPYRAEAATGVRYDDPRFAISWPIVNPVLSSRDRAWPDFEETT